MKPGRGPPTTFVRKEEDEGHAIRTYVQLVHSIVISLEACFLSFAFSIFFCCSLVLVILVFLNPFFLRTNQAVVGATYQHKLSEMEGRKVGLSGLSLTLSLLVKFL